MIDVALPSILPDAIRSQWPYTPRFARVNGWRMHYIDEGVGDPVVLLHGNPTWGFLYRDVIPPLVADGHRVIVPDMIGFGLSEKPTREHAHSLDGHVANLVALIRQLDLQRMRWFVRLGRTDGAGLLSNPERMRALVIMSTWAWPMPPRNSTRISRGACAACRLSLGRHNALAGRVFTCRSSIRAISPAGAGGVQAVRPTLPAFANWTWPRWIPLDRARPTRFECSSSASRVVGCRP
jgi:haloalkane dehalogenase